MIVIARWACSTHAFKSSSRCSDEQLPDCKYEWIGSLASRFGVPFTHWMSLPEPPKEG
jgi:hypothetical protein